MLQPWKIQLLGKILKNEERKLYCGPCVSAFEPGDHILNRSWRPGEETREIKKKLWEHVTPKVADRHNNGATYKAESIEQRRKIKK